jgi:hypothetical protein
VPSPSAEQTGADALWEEVARIPHRFITAPRRTRGSGILAAALILIGLLSAFAGMAWWQMRGDRQAELSAAEPTDVISQVVPHEPSSPAVAEPADEAANVAVPLSRKTPPSPATRTTVAPATVVSAGPEKAPAASQDAASAERLAAFQRAVHRARQALAARDLDEAAGQLDAAEKNIILPKQRDEVRQLRALAKQLGLFFVAVRGGLKKFQPTEVIHVDDLVAAIVEVGPESVTLFIEGARRNFTIATMPASIMLFFARAGADEKSPLAAIFFGAFYAVDPQGDPAKARQLWQQAAAADVPVEDLLPLVAGPALASRREPIPDAALVDAAGKVLEERFAEAIVGAKSGVQKSKVALQLLDAARQASHAAEQYAALSQARDWAISAGDPATALEASDALGKSFDVDALMLKSAALGAATAGTLTPKSAARAATAAIELSAEAQRAGGGELALSLADTGYTCARKSHDSALVKRAYQRRSEAQSFENQSRSRKAKSSAANR